MQSLFSAGVWYCRLVQAANSTKRDFLKKKWGEALIKTWFSHTQYHELRKEKYLHSTYIN